MGKIQQRNKEVRNTFFPFWRRFWGSLSWTQNPKQENKVYDWTDKNQEC